MPRTGQSSFSIADALTSDAWTVAEKCVIKWQFGLYGHFHTQLFELITLADDNNLSRLRMAYPAEVEGFLLWNRGDLGKRLMDAGIPL